MATNNWPVVRIGDIVTVKRGASPRPIQEYLDNKGLPWVKIADATSEKTRYIYKTAQFIKESGKKHTVIVEPGTLIVSNSATPGLPKIMKIQAGVHDGWLVISDYKRVTEDFMYYKFLDIRRKLVNHANGSVFQNLKTDIVKNYEINLPPLEIQRKIVGVLKTIDDKLEDNYKCMNAIIELAETIFEEYFINDSSNGTTNFSEFIENMLNGDWGKEAPSSTCVEKVYCVRGADIPEINNGCSGKMPTRYIVAKNFKNKKLSSGDLVVEISGGSPTQSTGRIMMVNESLLKRYENRMVCTNFCKAIHPKKDFTLFIFHYWKHLYKKNVFFSYENGTTGIKNLDINSIIEKEVINIPDKNKLKKFNDICEEIYAKVNELGIENEHLQSLQDTLLPKLMTGEVDVSNIKIEE